MYLKEVITSSIQNSETIITFVGNMEKISVFVEKLFLWLLKAVYYLMKVSFGLVMGTIIGLVIYLIIGEGRFGVILLSLFAGIGLIAGIIYAEKARKSNDSPYFNRQNL